MAVSLEFLPVPRFIAIIIGFAAFPFVSISALSVLTFLPFSRPPPVLPEIDAGGKNGKKPTSAINWKNRLKW